MANFLQDIINSRVGVGTGLVVGRIIPAVLGYPLARFLGSIAASRKNSHLVSAIRSNHQVVREFQESPLSLDDAVKTTLRNQATCLFDFYHNLYFPSKIKSQVDFSPAFQEVFERCNNDGVPRLFVAPHIGGFDQAGLALAYRGLHVQVLSYPNPGSGYQWQNKIRSEGGLKITPISMSSVSEARKRLLEGGTVLTGLDRPNPDKKYQPRFFGRPTALPVFYVRLALKTNAEVRVVASFIKPNHKYELDISDPIHFNEMDDPNEEILANAERVLAVAEQFILRAPYQWSMFYPLWPDQE